VVFPFVHFLLSFSGLLWATFNGRLSKYLVCPAYDHVKWSMFVTVLHQVSKLLTRQMFIGHQGYLLPGNFCRRSCFAALLHIVLVGGGLLCKGHVKIDDDGLMGLWQLLFIMFLVLIIALVTKQGWSHGCTTRSILELLCPLK
jgi:hypothetical protein